MESIFLSIHPLNTYHTNSLLAVSIHRLYKSIHTSLSPHPLTSLPFTTGKKSHRRLVSDSSDFSFTGKAQIATLLASECTLECRYMHCIANLFLKFSLSDAAVVVGMARESECMHSVMAVLQSPALRDYISKVGCVSKTGTTATAASATSNSTGATNSSTSTPANAATNANTTATTSVHDKNKERERPSLLNTNHHNNSNHSNNSIRDTTHHHQHPQVPSLYASLHVNTINITYPHTFY